MTVLVGGGRWEANYCEVTSHIEWIHFVYALYFRRVKGLDIIRRTARYKS